MPEDLVVRPKYLLRYCDKATVDAILLIVYCRRCAMRWIACLYVGVSKHPASTVGRPSPAISVRCFDTS